ncbi:MAG TPA: NAD(P)-dependent oxidoreductase [Terracidiphilus sp.]|nr:NAD(P)-dependent oxidoreductase [Terracidiphilus sp.]
MNPSIALLGLGTMGRGMAANLLKAGFPLTVWNRTRSKADALSSSGAAVADTPAQAAQDATVVIAMLADDAASRAAWLGEDGAMAGMSSGSVAVECSTLSPDWIRELHEAVTQRGLRMVEAPVTGSRTQAEAGQLNFLVGADQEVLDAVTPVLRCMSRDILHLGPVGSGAQLKLINNFLCAVQVASFAEALAWMEQTGLRLDTALDFLKRGAPGSGILSAMSERMTHRTYEVNFLLRLMAKDLRYARLAAAQLGIDVSTSSPAQDLFRQAEDQGLGEKDMSAVVEVVRRASEKHIKRTK